MKPVDPCRRCTLSMYEQRSPRMHVCVSESWGAVGECVCVYMCISDSIWSLQEKNKFGDRPAEGAGLGPNLHLSYKALGIR